MLKLVEEDKLLKPFAGIIERRHRQMLAMEREFTYRATRLADSCNSYLYYGLHRTIDGWIFREWAPNATAIYLLGEFNDWRKHPDYALTKAGDGNWEIKLPREVLVHEMLYRLLVEWDGEAASVCLLTCDGLYRMNTRKYIVRRYGIRKILTRCDMIVRNGPRIH